MKVSIGVCAYNEAANIGYLLDKICKESCFSEILVIASGCTDDTVKIASDYPVKLIIQEKREGKASAVNLFIKEAKGDILVLCGGDIIPADFAFKHLLACFEDPNIGMVGAHSVPVNSLQSLIDRAGHLLWGTVHQISLTTPKCGEVCAFRNVVKSINPKTPVDEASLEYEIRKKGFQLAYAPDAVIFNKAPTTVSDFIKQRERIFIGHLGLDEAGYTVPTMRNGAVLKASIKIEKNPVVLLYSMWLELRARNRAQIIYTTKKEYHNWERVESTKELK